MSISLIAIPALVILALVGIFIGWGVSLIWRGMSRARSVQGRRSCPSCNEDMRGLTTLTCPTCKNAALAEADLCASKPIRAAIIGGFGSIGVGILTLFGSWYGYHNAVGDDGDPLGMESIMAVGIGMIGIAFLARGSYGDRARGRRRCPKCWYPIRTENLTCPECGKTATHEKQFFRTRRSAGMIAAGAAVLVLTGAPFLVANYRSGGAVGLMPTAALIVCMPIVPDEWLSGGVASADEDMSLHARLDEEYYFPILQGKYRDAAALRALKLAINDPSAVAKYLWVIRMPESIGAQREFMGRLVSALESSDPRVAGTAAKIAGHLMQDRMWNALSGPDHAAEQPAEKSIEGLEPRLIALLSHRDPSVADAALDLASYDGHRVPGIAEYFIDQLRAGRQLNLGAWGAIVRHSKPPLPTAQVLPYITDANLPDALFFVFAMDDAALTDPAWLDRLVTYAEDESTRAIVVAASIYSRRKLAPDIMTPLIASQIGDHNKTNERLLAYLALYGKDAPESLAFTEMSLLSSSPSMQAVAMEALGSVIRARPEWTSYARSAALSRLKHPNKDTAEGARSLLYSVRHPRVQDTNPEN